MVNLKVVVLRLPRGTAVLYGACATFIAENINDLLLGLKTHHTVETVFMSVFLFSWLQLQEQKILGSEPIKMVKMSCSRP